MHDDDYIPLSYLSQFYFCKRRAGLLILEQVWIENEYTAEGRADHDAVHRDRIEKRNDFIRIHDYYVYSDALKLTGKCDCIEAKQSHEGYRLPFAEGYYTLFPIEYKHGVIRNEEEYNVQLCAQAMCLEEMLNCSIEKGAIFYTDSHRRIEVIFTNELRDKVSIGAEKLHEILRYQRVPYEVYSAKCKKCSLLEYCLPKVRHSSSDYLRKVKVLACGMEDLDEKIE